MFNLLIFFACSSPLDKCRNVCRTERAHDCWFEWDYVWNSDGDKNNDFRPSEKEFVQKCLLRDIDSTHEWFSPAPKDFFSHKNYNKCLKNCKLEHGE